MKKIKVFLRQWNGAITRSKHLKTRPTWFSYEKCYRSLKSSKDIDLTIVLDGTIDNHHFKFDKEDKIIESKGGSDFSSFQNCLNAVEKSNPNNNDIIYLVEDDYLHKPGWSSILLEAFESFDVDYATLYDHKDNYFLQMYNELQSKILVTKNVYHNIQIKDTYCKLD